MSVFIRLNQGGAVNYKASVDSPGDLPSTGNQPGDIRGVVSTTELYMWDGSSWVNVSSGGGGGSPGGSSGTIQYNASGSFAGSSELTWDNTGKVLGLNGLAIKALSSSVSLTDGVGTPTNVPGFSWPASSYEFNIVEISLTRNNSKAVGLLFICNDATSASITHQGTSLSDLGINLSVNVSAGTVNVQYTSSATGFNAFMKYAIRQWI